MRWIWIDRILELEELLAAVFQVVHLVAGLVLTALLAPVGMGYAQASGLPAIYGPYATIVRDLIGKKIAAPLILAPIGLCGMQHGDGEILSARAANEAGIPFTLSTMSICSIEDVAEATGKPFWFQLYMMRDRDAMAALVPTVADEH